MDSGGSQWMYGKGGKRSWARSNFSMEEFYDSGDTKITTLATLDGVPVKTSTFTLEEEDFMPSTVFQELDPEYTEYAGYLGNEHGDTSYLYHRSVLIISL